MTFKTLIDAIVHMSGEDGNASYRQQVLMWLNVTRSEIADRAMWRTAMRPGQTFLANTASNVHRIGSGRDHILGDEIWNETDNLTIRHDSFANARSRDPDLSVTGPPIMWDDAGVDTAGERQVFLWPRPSTTITVYFNSYKKIDDVTSADEGLDRDPFFGDLDQWSACFLAGMRYWMEADDNEGDKPASRVIFEQMLKRRLRRNGVAPANSIPALPMKSARPIAMGRFDPAHYRN